MVNSTDFAKRLQKILDYYGVSATAFSEEIDFNRSTISHLLSGRNKPSLEFVMKVLQKYPEVELYWLLNGKGVFPNETSSPPSEKNENIPPTLHQPIKENQTEIKMVSDKKNMHTSTNEIERIVVFYKDGSFKAYEN